MLQINLEFHFVQKIPASHSKYNFSLSEAILKGASSFGVGIIIAFVFSNVFCIFLA
jgi:hypothetical protein